MSVANGRAKKSHFDPATVKAAAATRWPEILSALGGLPSSSLDGRHHPCPKCGGTDRFRLMAVDVGAVLCNQCFSSRNGDGLAALQWSRGWDFATALAELAGYLGVAPDSNSTGSNSSSSKPDPTAHLSFMPWSEMMVTLWAKHKPGVTAEAVRAAGGRIARYRGQWTVIALPIFGQPFDLISLQFPVGWVLFNLTGGTLPAFRGKGNAPTQEKMLTTFGSGPGLIGESSLRRLWEVNQDPSARLLNPLTIIKSEGVSDSLAAFASIPADLRNTYLTLTNAAGCQEKPRPEWFPLFAGHRLLIVHDCDSPGQHGATVQQLPDGRQKLGWCPTLAGIAGEVKNIDLGYPVAPDHGKDFRDWLADGNGFGDLLELADGATAWGVSAGVVGGGPASTAAAGLPTNHSANNGQVAANGHAGAVAGLPASVAPSLQLDNESADDPHRLARVYLNRYAVTSATPDDVLAQTIRFCRGQWKRWNGCRYLKITQAELRAEATGSTKHEFARLNKADLAAPPRDGGLPETRKVTRTTISNLIGALEGMTVISGDCEQGWLVQEPGFGAGHGTQSFGRIVAQPRNYIALNNGILDLDRLLGLGDEEAALSSILLHHTPRWFSSICLPYDFDPDAECPIFEAFLEKNLAGDEERIAILQEWAGYLLLPNTSQQKFLFLEGEGANGKSVYFAAMTAMLGVDSCSQVTLENFGLRFQLTETIGKLANIVADVGEIDRVAEGILKSFTSGDRMSFEFKNQDLFSASPTARLMLSANSRPRFGDRSGGLWRRMLLIPFTVKIQDHEKVLNMDKHEWWTESGELPGILNWAIAGLHRLRQQGLFTRSKVMEAAIEDYRGEVNPARDFLGQFYSEHPESRVGAADAYKKYADWSTANGVKPLGERNFGKEVARKFPSVTRRYGGTRVSRFYVYDGLQEKNNGFDDGGDDWGKE